MEGNITMPVSTLETIITAVGSLFGALIGAYATLQAVKVKASNNPIQQENKFPLIGVIAGAVIGAIATLTVLILFGFISLIPPVTAPTAEPITEKATDRWVLGELIYEEDFEDELINGLRTEFGRFDIVKMNDGNHVWQTSTVSDSKINLPTKSNDYAVEAKIMQVSGKQGFGFIEIRIKSEEPCNTNYGVYLDGYGDVLNLIERGNNCIELREEGLFAYQNVPLSNGIWYTLRIEAKGAEVKVYLDDKLIVQDKDIDGTVRQSNTIAFSACCDDLLPYTFNFDDIKVWLINP
jgi:hypothetical protein